MNYIIYRIRNLANWKEYIGQTVGPLKKRLKKHFWDASHRTSKTAIQRAICKYGERNFEISEICRCESKKEMDEVERFCILYFKTKTSNGYNLTDGGDGTLGSKRTEDQLVKMRAWKRTEERSAKISAALTGRKLSEEHRAKCKRGNGGRKHSEETKAKRSASLMGHEVTEETRKKISSANIGKQLSEEHRAKIKLINLGRRWSPEAIEKRRISCTGKKRSDESKTRYRLAWTEERKSKNSSEEHRAKLRAAWIIRKQRRPHDRLA